MALETIEGVSKAAIAYGMAVDTFILRAIYNDMGVERTIETLRERADSLFERNNALVWVTAKAKLVFPKLEKVLIDAYVICNEVDSQIRLTVLGADKEPQKAQEKINDLFRFLEKETASSKQNLLELPSSIANFLRKELFE